MNAPLLPMRRYVFFLVCQFVSISNKHVFNNVADLDMDCGSGGNVSLESTVSGNGRQRKILDPDTEAQRKYERERKQRQRRRKNGGIIRKRGPKVKFNIKEMTLSERRDYERIKKRQQRLKKSMIDSEIREYNQINEDEGNVGETLDAKIEVTEAEDDKVVMNKDLLM